MKSYSGFISLFFLSAAAAANSRLPGLLLRLIETSLCIFSAPLPLLSTLRLCIEAVRFFNSSLVTSGEYLPRTSNSSSGDPDSTRSQCATAAYNCWNSGVGDGQGLQRPASSPAPPMLLCGVSNTPCRLRTPLLSYESGGGVAGMYLARNTGRPLSSPLLPRRSPYQSKRHH